MRVGQRLFLAVLPAVLGVFTVAGLTYWGRYARQAPEWVVVIAFVAALGSLVVAWRNTRYVATRIEELVARRSGQLRNAPLQQLVTLLEDADVAAALDTPDAQTESAAAVASGTPVSVDELDTIERAVERLTTALVRSRSDAALLRASAEKLQQEYAGLVLQAADEAGRRLEEARLPVHILLENRFGELNDNQEEMLGAAAMATEALGGSLSRLRTIASSDLGTLHLRSDRIELSRLIHSIVPALIREADKREIHVSADVAPALPLVRGDRSRLQEAFAELLRASLRRVAAGGTLQIRAERDRTMVRTVVTGSSAVLRDTDIALARRLILHHHGTVETTSGSTTVTLPGSDV